MSEPDPAVRRAIESLQRLAELFAQRRRALAAEAGLTETQWRVLEEIAGEEFMPSMFARGRDCTPAAVSRTLRRLLEQGLVEASIGEADARQRVYRLTPRGRGALARLHASRRRAIDAVWTPLDPRELERFSRFASRLADRLEDYAAGLPEKA